MSWDKQWERAIELGLDKRPYREPGTIQYPKRFHEAIADYKAGRINRRYDFLDRDFDEEA